MRKAREKERERKEGTGGGKRAGLLPPQPVPLVGRHFIPPFSSVFPPSDESARKVNTAMRVSVLFAVTLNHTICRKRPVVVHCRYCAPPKDILNILEHFDSTGWTYWAGFL